MVAFAGGTFVVSSGAVICLLIITVAVSEKSRKLLGFLRKCVPPYLPLLDHHLQCSAVTAMTCSAECHHLCFPAPRCSIGLNESAHWLSW